MATKDAAAWGAVQSFMSLSPSGEAEAHALLDDMNARLDALLLVNHTLSSALEAREEAELRAGRGFREDGGTPPQSSPLAAALGVRPDTLPPLRRLDAALPPLAVLGHSPGVPLCTARSAPEEARRIRRALPPPPLPQQTDSWEAAMRHGRQRAAASADSGVGPLLRNSFGRVSNSAPPQGARRRVVSVSGVLLPFGPPRRSGK